MARGHRTGKGRTRAISKQSGSNRVRSGTTQSGKQDCRQTDSARQANAAGDGTLRLGTRPALARAPEKSPGSAEKVWHQLTSFVKVPERFYLRRSKQASSISPRRPIK